MQLEFFGAAGEVTGSCHILRVAGRQLLLDCGMIQGDHDAPARNRLPFPFDPTAIDAVVLSHAHIDHCGRLPLLVKRGYRGPIYTNKACADLVPILLRDSANLACATRSASDVEPLYDLEDVETTLRLLQPIAYDTQRELLPGVTVRVRDAGHILGSSSVELWVSEGGEQRKLVFSGDLGQYDTPILQDPWTFESADRRAHGEHLRQSPASRPRRHRARARRHPRAGAARRRQRDRAGVRHRPQPGAALSTGEALRRVAPGALEDLSRQPHGHRRQPRVLEHIRIASTRKPRACARASAACRRCRISCCRNPRTNRAPSIRCAAARSSSRAPAWPTAAASCITSNTISNVPSVTWSSSASRRRERSGGSSSTATPEVRIHGQRVRCLAQIHTLGGLSAHGDQDDLLRWYDSFAGRPPVYLVHGEVPSAEALAEKLRERGASATVTRPGLTIDLANLRALPTTD